MVMEPLCYRLLVLVTSILAMEVFTLVLLMKQLQEGFRKEISHFSLEVRNYMYL